MALQQLVRFTLASAVVPLTLIGTAALSPATGTTGNGTRRLASIEDSWRQRAAVPAVVLAVQDGNRRPWVRASGTAERGGRTPLATDAPFRVASITKTFVSVVVLQLVHEGRLALSDPASEYLPGTPGLDGVTVEQLLDHTSGLPEYNAVDEHFGPNLLRDRDRRWSADELIALAATARRAFDPGTDYAYCNTEYLVLGKVVQAVTGRTWAEEVRRRVLDPLHLTHTYVAGAEQGRAVIPGYFDADDDGDEENIETGGDWTSLATSEGAAGAIVSTAADLTTYADALFHGRLLDHAGLRLMTADRPFHSRGSNYGLGLEISRPDWTTTIWGHGGYVPGFRSTLWYVPSADLTIVVLANSSSANTSDLAELALRAAARE
jgi:D-alanyl-D-alanine carboxypeptidase